MTCPFLRETAVRYCHRSSVSKPIPSTAKAGVEERCHGPGYVDCPVYRRGPMETGTQSSCPLLAESVMQYCSASMVTKFIPRSASALSRCASDAHRFCDLYLDLTQASRKRSAAADSIPLPENLLYTTNHWWLAPASDGPCHLGIDGFLARLLGTVDRIEFLPSIGQACPAVVFTFGGGQAQAVFPEPLPVCGYNTYLRGDPARLTAEPYARGWLLQACVSASSRDRLHEALMDATAARAWLETETRHVNERIQRFHADLAADGGMFVPGLLRNLDRESALRLFHEFASPRRASEEAAE